MAFKTIIQTDSMQCGVACLAMICRHYGQEYSIHFLEQFCHATTEGVSIKGINDAAIDLGFRSAVARISFDRLKDCPLPVILHWNQNHFVILYKIKNNFFYIADPAKGKRKLSKTEFESHWGVIDQGILCGIVMAIVPTDKFGEISDNSSSVKSFSILGKHMFRYKKHLGLIVTGMLLGCIFQFAFPFLTQQIVDTGIRLRDIGFIWLILCGEFMIIVGQTLADFMRRWFLLKVSVNINISLVSDFFVKLLKLPMSFFDVKLMGDLLQRIGDHSRVQTFMTNQVLTMTFSVLSFIVFGIILWVYSYIVFLIFITGSAVYGLWISSFLRKRKVIDYDLFELQSKNQQVLHRFLTSIQEIKLQGCEKRRRSEWEDVQSRLFDVQMRSLKLQQQQESGAVFLNEVKNILITVFAATGVINGNISLGSMLAIQYIVGQLNSPVEQIMAFIYSIQDVKISLDRINEIHEREEEENPKGISSFNEAKSINIKDICFKYDLHALENTLENVSVDIAPGKVTAIVGASGSGKTTLLKLILGYYKPAEGTISVSGRNLSDYSIRWFRDQCGVVMQDGIIFSESIRRNIANSDADVDEDLIYKAAKIANIHDYVMSLPLKYDTNIGPDGVGLSQGQKQRILIARAVYKNPDFIFLDEATNALDASNERTIVNNLNEFYKKRTVIVVAHRLSTVKNADNIIVFDKGRIIETGNHDSLILKKGAYYHLIKDQLELGQ